MGSDETGQTGPDHDDICVHCYAPFGVEIAHGTTEPDCPDSSSRLVPRRLIVVQLGGQGAVPGIGRARVPRPLAGEWFLEGRRRADDRSAGPGQDRRSPLIRADDHDLFRSPADGQYADGLHPQSPRPQHGTERNELAENHFSVQTAAAQSTKQIGICPITRLPADSPVACRAECQPSTSLLSGSTAIMWSAAVANASSERCPDTATPNGRPALADDVFVEVLTEPRPRTKSAVGQRLLRRPADHPSPTR